MSSSALESILEQNRGGVWFLPAHKEPRALQKLAKEAGYAFFHIEGKAIGRKEQLLNHMATAMRFPKEFGHNWDEQSENTYVDAFRGVSGWRVHDNGGGSLFPPDGYLSSSDDGATWDYLASSANTFAREYGKTNPLEDMGTTWEAYFVYLYHGGTAGITQENLVSNAAKWGTLDALFSELQWAP